MTPYRAAPDAPEPDRDGLALAWRPRPTPRPATVVVAAGPAADALRRRLLRLPDAALLALRGVADPRHVVVLGAADALPWVDGATYLGRCPDAPALALPTALDPTLPPGLLERALAARLAPLTGPFALWPDARGAAVVCCLAAARPLDRALVRGALPR